MAYIKLARILASIKLSVTVSYLFLCCILELFQFCPNIVHMMEKF